MGQLRLPLAKLFPRRQVDRPLQAWCLGLILLWAFCLALRFWGLGRFNTLVFDEIYFARFGHHYLTQTPFFDGHPPLGKYFIAVGIWLQGFTTWGYRWMNALVGSLIPIIIAGIAERLTHRYRFALLAGAFASLDGLLLVESRYALLNVYLLFFGLLAHYCFLTALDSRRQWLWIVCTALCIGATAAVKWNGLGLALGLYALWGLCWLAARLKVLPPGKLGQQLARLSPLVMAGMVAIASLCYSLIWIPHLLQNPASEPSSWTELFSNFGQLHTQILTYHQRVGSGPEVHPYCAAWHTWPLMLRPLSYFYQRASDPTALVPIYGPSLPTASTPWIFDVHAIGNPPLWWASTLAMLCLLFQVGHWGITRLRIALLSASDHPSRLALPAPWVSLYLCINYTANFLPWTLVSRCTFIYHYMPAAVFSSLAAAWFVDQGLSHPHRLLRVIALMMVWLAILGFIFWLPIYLGLPLSQTGWQLRLRFPSWI